MTICWVSQQEFPSCAEGIVTEAYSRIYRFPGGALNAKTHVEFVLSVLLITIQSYLRLFVKVSLFLAFM